MQRRNAARHAPMMYVKTARPDPLVCANWAAAIGLPGGQHRASGSGIGIVATQQRTSLRPIIRRLVRVSRDFGCVAGAIDYG
jgi:hypothetical protein